MAPMSLRTRGAVIRALLESVPIAMGAIKQFEDIHQRLLDIVDRHEIAARNCAVISTQRLLFIDVIEKDILSAAPLYIRLSNWASILGEIGPT
jgi:hypothetical protein